jgi:hypothetical protein
MIRDVAGMAALLAVAAAVSRVLLRPFDRRRPRARRET